MPNPIEELIAKLTEDGLAKIVENLDLSGVKFAPQVSSKSNIDKVEVHFNITLATK